MRYFEGVMVTMLILKKINFLISKRKGLVQDHSDDFNSEPFFPEFNKANVIGCLSDSH